VAEYQYQLLEQVLGPVSMPELVRLVQSDTLTADDLVKADYDDEWIPAAAVVGLFHMAGRDDILKVWEEEQRLKLEAEMDTSQFPDTDEDLDGEEMPEWKRRMAAVEAERIARERELEAELKEERDAEKLSETLASTISEADQAAADKEARRKNSLLYRLSASIWLRQLFRLSIAALMAYLVLTAIWKWNMLEAQRFPIRGVETLPNTFPLWGICSSKTFQMLMIDTGIVSGILGYGIAVGIERYTD